MTYIPIVLSAAFLLFCAVIAYCLKNYYPKEPNPWVGYRTRRSLKSNDSWTLANAYAGKLLFRYSIAEICLFPLVVVIAGPPAQFVFLITACLWTMALFTTIFQTERMLKKSGY